MVNAMELLQGWRGADQQNALRAAQMEQMQMQGQREAAMHPLQIQAAQMNMLAKRQAMQQDEMRRNALQQYGATGNINALAMGDPEMAAKVRMMQDRMTMRAGGAGGTRGAAGGGMPKPTWDAARGVFIYPPTPENPQGAVVQPQGLPSVAKEEKPMTEFQGKASLFGTRMQNSHDILTPLEANTSQTGLAVKRSLQDTPMIGGILGAAANLALSNNQQSIEQAQRDFINATLRQESGAVISPEEFENAQRQYFPQPGDNPALLEQKRKNREIAIAGFERMAGKEGGAAIRDVRNMRKGDNTGGASGGWDDSKESRYQELLRKRNAAK